MPVSTADLCWLVMSRSGLGPGTCPRTGRPEQWERCRAGQGWADLRLRSRPVQEADGKRRPSEGQGKILISLKMLRFLVEWADDRWELRTRGTRGIASKPWPSMIRMNDFMTRLCSILGWTSANQACLRRVGLVNQPKSEVAQVILSTPVLSIVLQEHLPHCPSRSERRLRGWPDWLAQLVQTLQLLSCFGWRHCLLIRPPFPQHECDFFSQKIDSIWTPSLPSTISSAYALCVSRLLYLASPHSLTLLVQGCRQHHFVIIPGN